MNPTTLPLVYTAVKVPVEGVALWVFYKSVMYNSRKRDNEAALALVKCFQFLPTESDRAMQCLAQASQW